MLFPLTIPDIGLWLVVTAIMLLVASELIFSLPKYSARFILDRRLLRMCAVGCGLGFCAIVLMRVAGFP